MELQKPLLSEPQESRGDCWFPKLNPNGQPVPWQNPRKLDYFRNWENPVESYQWWEPVQGVLNGDFPKPASGLKRRKIGLVMNFIWNSFKIFVDPKKSIPFPWVRKAKGFVMLWIWLLRVRTWP